MSNVQSFREYANKKSGAEFVLCNLEDFMSVANSDAKIAISIHPFHDPVDDFISGWWVGYIDLKTGGHIFVAEDDHNGVDDFMLWHKDIEEVFKMLAKLNEKDREITVYHKNSYEE